MKHSQKNNVSLGLVRTNAKQLFISKNFYISIVMVLFIMLLTFLSNSRPQIDANGACYELFNLVYFGMLPKLIILISAMPVVTGFCADWNTQYIRSVVSRTGVGRYARQKVYACMAGTFITAFIALSIFTVFLLFIMPVNTEFGIYNLEPLYPFGRITEQHPYLWLLIKNVCFSSFCSLWSVLGLALSSYIPNRYIVCTSPFVIYYVIEQIINNKITKDVPTFLYLPYLGITSLTTPLFGNVIIDFLYINVLFIGLALLFGEAFVYGVKRRMRNEIV